jgi:hypothetical protein
MAEAPRKPETGDIAGTPRWVKVAGAITLLVVLLFVIVKVAGGEHGPGRHSPSDNRGGHTGPP